VYNLLHMSEFDVGSEPKGGIFRGIWEKFKHNQERNLESKTGGDLDKISDEWAKNGFAAVKAGGGAMLSELVSLGMATTADNLRATVDFARDIGRLDLVPNLIREAELNTIGGVILLVLGAVLTGKTLYDAAKYSVQRDYWEFKRKHP